MDPKDFTEKSLEIIKTSIDSYKEQSHTLVHPLHVACALADDPDATLSKVLSLVGGDSREVFRRLKSAMVKLPAQDPRPSNVQFSQEMSKVVDEAVSLRKKMGDSHVAVDHLIIAVVKNAKVQECFGNIKEKDLEGAVKQLRKGRKVESATQDATSDVLAKYGKDLVKDAEDGKLDPVIGRDGEIRRVIQVLTRRTKNNPVLIGEPGVGKTAVVEGLAQRIVAKDVPENLRDCRVWSLDMGALVAGAKFRGEFEERLQSVLKEVKESNGKIVMFIDEIHLVLGAGKAEGAMDAANLLKPLLARGELRCIGATTLNEYRQHVEKDAAFERRFQQVMVSEPSVTDTISILRGLKSRYEAHHGVRVADSALVAAAQLSSRYIQQRFLPDKAIDLLDEACANVRVQLDSQPEALDKLERRKLQLEIEHQALKKETDKNAKVRLEKVNEELAQIKEEYTGLQAQYLQDKKRVDALRDIQKKIDDANQTIEVAERRYNLERAADIRYNVLPELQKQMAELTKQQEQGSNHGSALLTEVVQEEQIAQIVSRWTGIPVTRLSQSEKDKVLNLDKELKRRVVGQDAAINAVAETILRSRAGMSRPNQPNGSFLFLGSTGTGKTETAKALAQSLFDSEKHMIRLDMSEYSEQHSVARMIGSPPGYVGHDEGGQLTEAVRRQPYSVILMDEVEKAHPLVLNILLQVLDDGRLTDGKGRVVDFSNTIVILTSNLGANYLNSGGGSGVVTDAEKQQVMQAVRAHFRPEFLNRLDEIVIFSPLGKDQLRQIAAIQLRQVTDRLLERNISVTATNKALDFILASSYDPAYGARPVRRFVEKVVGTDISRMLLRAELIDDNKLTIDSDGKEFVYGVDSNKIEQKNKKVKVEKMKL